jgi:hypothetical protein
MAGKLRFLDSTSDQLFPLSILFLTSLYVLGKMNKREGLLCTLLPSLSCIKWNL